MFEGNYQITIPYKDYKILKEKENAYKELVKSIESCFDKKYALQGKPIPIYKDKLISIGKTHLPMYCKYSNFIEV